MVTLGKIMVWIQASAGGSAVSATWREQIKAYIIARLLDPGHLTESQINSIISFAQSLAPVKKRIELIKSQHHPEDVGELIYHLKVVVKDSAKKLQMLIKRQKPERDSRRDVAEPPGKCYPLLFCLRLTNSCSQFLISSGTPHFPLCFENAYYSSHRL